MSSTTPNPGLGLSDWQVAGANNCPSDLKNDGTSTTECSLAAEGQLVLDPRCKSISGVWNPKGALHCCTRQLGRFPDTSHWQVGDLILFGEINPGFRSRSIALAQTSLGYAPKDARWTHAAVYVERDYICHATPFRGVRYEKIYPYIGNHILRVRRDASLSQSERFQIALQAAVRRQRYSLRELAALGRLSFSRSVLARFKDSAAKNLGLICSTLYADAYYKATSKTLQDPASGELIETVTPAFLSYTPRLSDVKVEWLSIV